MNITAENVERLAKVEGNGAYLVQVERREIQRSPLTQIRSFYHRRQIGWSGMICPW